MDAPPPLAAVPAARDRPRCAVRDPSVRCPACQGTAIFEGREDCGYCDRRGYVHPALVHWIPERLIPLRAVVWEPWDPEGAPVSRALCPPALRRPACAGECAAPRADRRRP